MSAEPANPASLAPAALERDGYFVARGLVNPDFIRKVRQSIEAALNPLLGPVEFEAEVGYPGAPAGLAAEGGRTPRRLLHAASRFPALGAWAQSAAVTEALKPWLGEGALLQQRHPLASGHPLLVLRPA